MLAASCEPSEIEVPRVARVTQVTALHDYDVVYVRAPRYGDEGHAHWPEVKDPIRMEPGAEMRQVLHAF